MIASPSPRSAVAGAVTAAVLLALTAVALAGGDEAADRNTILLEVPPIAAPPTTVAAVVVAAVEEPAATACSAQSRLASIAVPIHASSVSEATTELRRRLTAAGIDQPSDAGTFFVIARSPTEVMYLWMGDASRSGCT